MENFDFFLKNLYVGCREFESFCVSYIFNMIDNVKLEIYVIFRCYCLSKSRQRQRLTKEFIRKT